ncbi:hypothetical protein OUO20_01795 [Arthrobacter sp. FX8]|uniref:hypothetical protein n=1 Tax=Arthrobacter sp. FX8 TaxID=2997335 RepID=UPI00227C081C|nr:hypothetical protein [Arthrobacter sp. FX8]WAJ33785.1 hypothetical protein OUO20_01795 [Arthrobacter sp. FX8]
MHLPLRRAAGAALSAGTALLASAALMLGSAVVAAPASAADPKVIGAVGQPLGIASGPDGTLYVSDYNWAGSVNVYRPGRRCRPAPSPRGTSPPRWP